MKNIHLLVVGLFLFSITLSAQSTQEEPTTSDNLIGYLEIENIDGESMSSLFKDQIEIYGLATLIEQSSATRVGQGRRRAKANVSPISMVKKIDAATPYLMLANMQGKSFKEAIITLVKSNNGITQDGYFIIKLENLVISKHQIDASSNRQEVFSLSFEHINIKYKTNNGSEHEISYDIAAGI